VRRVTRATRNPSALCLRNWTTMTEPEVFVVRIYRRAIDSADQVNGVVEVVRKGQEHAFSDLSQLLAILRTNLPGSRGK